MNLDEFAIGYNSNIIYNKMYKTINCNKMAMILQLLQ